MIIDNFTGEYYTGNSKICRLLNQESDRADRNLEMFDDWFRVLKKYGVNSPAKLDQILMNERVW